MTAQEHQKILDEISELRAIYWKKFGKDYGTNTESSGDVETTLADLKDCIENNHLQRPRGKKRPPDWD